MELFRNLLLFVVSSISISAFAQLEVQVGAGGHFANLSEVFVDGPGVGFDLTGDASFRPYVSGLVGLSLNEKWNLRGRFQGTSRAERNVRTGFSDPEELTTYNAYYIDSGLEIQWKPIAALGFSVGPYYALNISENAKVGDISIDLPSSFYSDYVAIRPAIEVYFSRFVARLDGSFGLSSVSRAEYTDANGQPLGEGRRYWNGASLGLSYRLIKA